MNITYIEPFSRAWGRMKAALFQPFDLHKWFVVGFNAFLAGLVDGPGGRGGANSSSKGDFSFRELAYFPQTAWQWLTDHPGWFALIVILSVFLLVLLIVLTWLSSRGSFMFLDNVMHDRAEVIKPWKQYRRAGNSLFLWRLGFGIICFFLFAGYMTIFFSAAVNTYRNSYSGGVPVIFIVQMVLLFLVLVLITGYISMFLKDFVVPIMAKHDLSTTRAWGRFGTVFKQHPFHFLLYGLIIFFITIGVVIMVIIAGLLTCCIGIILLIIPYIGSVITLPISYTYRAYSLEYLAQFGPEYDLLPTAENS